MDNKQANNPLHGIKLSEIVEFLFDEFGWERLGNKIQINCFRKDPSIKSSLKFLRRTEWARSQVENLYLKTIKNKKVSSKKEIASKSRVKSTTFSKRKDKVEAVKEVKKIEKIEKVDVPIKKIARKFGKR